MSIAVVFDGRRPARTDMNRRKSNEAIGAASSSPAIRHVASSESLSEISGVQRREVAGPNTAAMRFGPRIIDTADALQREIVVSHPG